MSWGEVILNSSNKVSMILLNIIFLFAFIPYCIIAFFVTGLYGYLTGTLIFICIVTWILFNVILVKAKRSFKMPYYLLMIFFNPILLLLIIISLGIYEKVTYEYHPLLQEALLKTEDLPSGIEVNIEETDEALKLSSDANQFYLITKNDITRQEVEKINNWIPKDGKDYYITFNKGESIYSILFEIRYENKLGRIRCLDASEVNDWCGRLGIAH
jgi:hypothetical protein